MKNVILKKLLLWLTVAVVLSGLVFLGLMAYMQKSTNQVAGQLGSLYMSEMMGQMQDHFESIVEMRTVEVAHIAAHAGAGTEEELHQAMRQAAVHLGFDYLALYDAGGNYETLLGEAAWFRGIDTFIGNVQAGKTVATTGFLTQGGDKYIVFGVPADYQMASGQRSAALLGGFSVEKLYDYIDLDGAQKWVGHTDVHIVLTNGAYVLSNGSTAETSFYSHISSISSFAGTDTDTGVGRIEKAMASGSSFSCLATIDGEQQHIYGAPAQEPSDWYFVLSMPQGAADTAMAIQSRNSVSAFVLASVVLLALYFVVFFYSMRLSMQQLSQTEQARREAEMASRAKSTFLFNASHDIRTPMNAIRGFAQMIAAHPGDEGLVRQTIAKVNQSSDTLMQLLNDVLELSRIESGKIQLEPAPLDLHRLMDNMQTMFQQDMQDAGINFRVQVQVEDGAVLCDGLKMTQILMNLLSNAKKFTPAGGQVTCGVTQEPGSDQYRFYVQDTGIGMSTEFQQRAFEQFERERTSTVSGVQGSGLGLSIIKRLVDQMEGTCTLESQLNQGTLVTIRVQLPKAELTAAQAQDVQVDPAVLKGRRVLLVEDNEFNREITRYILESFGISVEEACNGAVALETLATCPPVDAILMDIQMPVMDGFTAARQIRRMEDEALARLPIVAITANAFREDMERCLEAGMNAHVCKPVEAEELRRVLAGLLQNP